ncbi:CAP domain-containing protein [Mesobacillus sp. AQ2]|uniref:CAP domain-containing protein n=1 Tax=Mesobacillus sp. AQ2 TaxID=3043332 RepID=UPI0024C1D42A|nr:CAP domain-containing protein [Mesobacillus sp. AQ2]WHX41951.1 CAP domain-containing protein [Mesobacillus sp. AQ2]
MNIYKNGKVIAVSAVMLLGLAACNTNNDEAMDLRDNRVTTLGKDQAGYWDNDANRIKQQRRRAEINAAKGNKTGPKINQNGMNATSEIMQMPDGYITVDPNSYSTEIPSSKYPHTEMTEGGLTLTEGQQADLNNMREDLQRGIDVELPDFQRGGIPAPTEGAAPAPQQEAPAPDQVAPAPQERQAPVPEQGAAPAPAPQERQAPEQEAAPAPEQKAAPSGTEISDFESKVIDLTNEQRRKNGLSNLQPDTALSNVAQEKSNDMQAKNYFSHTSPTYGSPFDMMRDFGVSYNSAGENIAMGQPSPEEVVNAWMNSEGHRKNILSPNFTHIGVGHTSQGNYWTQMFIGK